MTDRCLECGRVLRPVGWFQALGEKWTANIAVFDHAQSLGRHVLSIQREPIARPGQPRHITGYNYIGPDDKPGYERNGFFCTLRCGFAFGVAAAKAGYRYKKARKA